MPGRYGAVCDRPGTSAIHHLLLPVRVTLTMHDDLIRHAGRPLRRRRRCLLFQSRRQATVRRLTKARCGATSTRSNGVSRPSSSTPTRRACEEAGFRRTKRITRTQSFTAHRRPQSPGTPHRALSQSKCAGETPHHNRHFAQVSCIDGFDCIAGYSEMTFSRRVRGCGANQRRQRHAHSLRTRDVAGAHATSGS